MSKKNSFGVGVDPGTMNVVSARRDGDKLTMSRIRDTFIDLPSEHKRMLKLSNIDYVEINNRLVVIGDDALNMANLLNCEARRPMAGGVMSAGELDAQNIMGLIMKKVLGDPKTDKEKCCFSVPAAAVDVKNSDILYHTMVLKKILCELGYDPEPINEAMAVIFSECLTDNFSGIGISYGSGMTNVCLSYNAMNAFEFSLGRGGDYIDNGAARSVGSTAARICSIKENGVDLMSSTHDSREAEAISLYITNLIDYTIDEIIKSFSKKKGEIHISKPIPIVISGGTSLAVGFIDKFKERFEVSRSKFPVTISEIRHAKDPMTSVASGLLLLAQSDD